MFKGILPSKRIVSSDFTMITNLADTTSNGKENHPETALPIAAKNSKPTMSVTKGKKRAQSKAKEEGITRNQPFDNQAFDKLLDDLQIPSTLRPKLATMDSTVKAAMLKSSQTMVLNPPSPPHTPRSAIRKAHSIDTIGTPGPTITTLDVSHSSGITSFPSGLVSAPYASSMGATSSPRVPSSHTRGASFHVPREFSRSQVNLSTTVSSNATTSKSTKDKGTIQAKNISPTKFFSILSSTSSTQLDVEHIKKLRLLLRNESASWSQEFLTLGGYSALLTRLNEILEVEWREEQHDDQVLHELLRCFKALSTSSIGCFALRSSCPTPFVQLIALLYSDKKPGDIATRQLIVDLILILFELYPSSSLPSLGSNVNSGRSRPRREAWDLETSSVARSNIVTLPAPHKTLYSLIRALLLTPAPPPTESPATPVSPHAFIESLHRLRIYKTYLQELSDVCRDYFWVFCHPNNTLWVLAETDANRVEKPRAPGGMTGGVEFEAMAYFTTHLKLINSVAKAAADLNLPPDNDLSAFQFHSDLFLSGLERIILISRKASTTYYPNLHLELARYVAFAGRAGFELPWTLSRLIGMPPAALSKNMSGSGRNTPATAVHISKRGIPAPALPSPQKIEPLRFE